MKKRVEVGDLRKGMYVAELDRPWLGTPFLFQGFEITSDEELGQLRKLCKFVYVLEADPKLVTAIRRKPAEAREPALAYAGDPAEGTVDLSGTERSGAAIPKHGTPVMRYPDITPLEEELGHASEIHQFARETLFSILDDARLGRGLDIPRAKKVVGDMAESIIRNPDAMVWLTHLKNKHEYTATHSLRVSVLALTLGRHLGYDREQLHILGTGALLHDIGKLKIPNELLDKPSALTREEYDLMKTHVPEGLKILDGQSGIPTAALEVVGRHHERYAGNGYVFGLSGDDIGEFGLISGIVDTYDAITSDRAYHMSLSAADALKIIYEGRSRAFHPWLVEQFIQCMGIFPIGSIVEMSNGSIGVVITANRERRLRPRVALVLSPGKQPCMPATVIDLMHVTHDAGKPLEIRKVLPYGSFDINVADHLPRH